MYQLSICGISRGQTITGVLEEQPNADAPPGETVEHQWGEVEPLKAYFDLESGHGSFESRVTIEYLIGDDLEVRRIDGSAGLEVE